MSSALISIKPKHVKNILNGSKTVELRTRSMNLPVGTSLWIYTTLPKGEIEAVAIVAFIDTKSPSSIWKKYKDQICITKSEFDNYTSDRKKVTVIGLSEIEESERKLCLQTLRTYDEKFTPPQFFIHLTPDKKIYSAFA